MPIFKSKEEKAMEQRMLLRRTINNMNKFTLSLEPKKLELIEKAKKAKLKGATSEYRLAVSGLKTIIAQQRQAETMILNFEITSQLKDLSKMTGEFLESMIVISKEMSKVADGTDFSKAANEFQRAMVKVNGNSEKIEAFLEETGSSFDVAVLAGNGISDNEIDKLIGDFAVDDENAADREIEEKVKNLERAMKQGE